MGQLQKIKDVIIYKDENYNTFPNIVQKADGEVFVAFRQAPDRSRLFKHPTHIDAGSKAAYVTSSDRGQTWSKRSEVLYDDYFFGVQDPCVNLLRDGTLFCSFFTWQVLLESDVPELRPFDRKIAGRGIGRPQGAYTIRSQDGGLTWDEPLPITNTGLFIRGNAVELDDGSILLPMYVFPEDNGAAMVAITRDRGQTWETLSTMASDPNYLFQEPNLFRTASGKIVAFIRTVKLDPNTPTEKKHPLVTCESTDDGRTWSPFVEHPVYSPSPFHILSLQSGNVLVTYGHRHEPYGIKALLLDGECTQISADQLITLRDDGLGMDIGYNSAVQLDNGDILVTYYYYDEPTGQRYIAGTWCREV